jgi:cell wall-associated NlpC family hydrolase
MRLPSFVPLDSVPGENGIVTRADVIAEARSWIGTPYAHQHRAKGIGADCLGLLIGCCRNLGLVAPDFDVNGYARKPDGVTLVTRCDEYMDPVREDDVKPGHVLVIAFKKEPQHIGILADYLYGGFSLIHAFAHTDGKGKVEEWTWQNDRKGFKAVAAYALRGVQ